MSPTSRMPGWGSVRVLQFSLRLWSELPVAWCCQQEQMLLQARPPTLFLPLRHSFHSLRIACDVNGDHHHVHRIYLRQQGCFRISAHVAGNPIHVASRGEPSNTMHVRSFNVVYIRIWRLDPVMPIHSLKRRCTRK